MNFSFDHCSNFGNTSIVHDFMNFNKIQEGYIYYKNNRYNDFVFNYKEDYYVKTIIQFHIALYIFGVYLFMISYMLFLLCLKRNTKKITKGRKRRFSSDASDFENQALERCKSLRSYKKQKTM